MYKHVAQQIEAHGSTRPLTPEKSKRKPAGKSGDLKPSSDHELAGAKDEIPPSSRTGETLVICPKDWRNIDAPPLLGMVCENLVVGWPYVQRASYISKHRPRTVDFLIVDQFLVNAFSTLVSQGGTRNLLNGADSATKSLSWQHGHVGEMVERNCVLRQPFVWAGHGPAWL